MPIWAVVLIHCTKPCEDLPVDMPSFQKKKSTVPQKAFVAYNCTAVCDKTRRKFRQWAADCPQGLIISRLIAQFWPFQQAVSKTKFWQSYSVTYVRAPSRHYGQAYTGLSPPCTVLQLYAGKRCTLKQAYMASRHTTGRWCLWLVPCKHQHGGLYHGT